MKKIFLFLIMGVIYLFGNSWAKAMDVNFPSYEFFPTGINYLNLDNFSMQNNGDIDLYFYSVKPFKIKPDETYTLGFLNYQNGHMYDIEVWEYDKDKNEIKYYMPNLDQELLPFWRFTVSMNTEYIALNFNICSNNDDFVPLEEMENMFLIASNKSLNEIINMQNIKPYESCDLTGLTLIENTLNLNSNLSNPLNVNDIKNRLKAFDITDGEVTSNITITSDLYSTNSFKVGTHEVKYAVVNTNGIKKEIKILINVVDDIAPVIYGNHNITMYTTDKKTVYDIKETLSASDSTDGFISNNDIYIIEDNFTNREAELGVYDIIFGVKDKTLNEGLFTVSINVLNGDNTKPVITGNTIYEVDTTCTLPVSEIIKDQKVIDDYDGDITSRIQIVSDAYTDNRTKIGTYNVSIKVSDNAGNSSSKILKIVVKNLTPPYFFITTTNFYLPLSKEMNSTDDIIKTLYKMNYINDTDVNITFNNYEENKYTPGEYNIIYEKDDEQYSVTINVVKEDDYNINPIKEEKGLFKKIGSFFKNIFGRIKNFFSS